MDATAVVSTALTIDMNNFIKEHSTGSRTRIWPSVRLISAIPIGWTLWHATRVEDGIIANISGKPQVWIEGAGTRSLTCRPIPARMALVIL